MKNLYDLGETVHHALELEMDFDIVYSGVSAKLKFLNEDGSNMNSHKYMEHFIKNRGSHLSQMTIQEVKKRMETGLYVPKNTDVNRHLFSTIAFNPDNITKFLEKPGCSVDINSCYWNTAHNITVISDKLCEYGFKEPKLWKDARNIAIGSLGTSVKVEKYRNGKLVEVSPYTPRPTNVCRLDVIDHVWDVCLNKIRPKLKKNFLTFLTDCFFVPIKSKDLVLEQLHKYGYEAKIKDAHFTAMRDLGTGTYKVIWETQMGTKSQHFNTSNIV